MDVEELCGAPVEADALALVDLALAVVGGDALLLAGLCETGEVARARTPRDQPDGDTYGAQDADHRDMHTQKEGGRGDCARVCVSAYACLPVHHVGHELHLGLDGSDLLCRGRLRATKSKERHVGRCRGVEEVFVVSL